MNGVALGSDILSLDLTSVNLHVRCCQRAAPAPKIAVDGGARDFRLASRGGVAGSRRYFAFVRRATAAWQQRT